jgi:hypothetical protein
MESAFGVEHGEISKGLKPAHQMSLARVLTGAGRSSGGYGDTRSSLYARTRLSGNKKAAQKQIEKPGNRDPRGNPDYSPTSNGFKIMSGSYPRSSGTNPRKWNRG